MMLPSSVPEDSSAPNRALPVRAHERVYQVLRQALRAGEAFTQPEISARTGLSLPAVIAAVSRLEGRGLVVSSGAKRGVGRPARAIRATPEANTVLGIDLGGSVLRAALYDLHGTKLHELETLSLSGFSHLSRSEALAHLRDVVRQVPQVRRVGLCAPGIVTPRGTLESSWLFGFTPLERADLEAALGLPVTLENDARSAAWGELRRGHGTDNFAFLSFAIGIGAGIVSGGRLLRGSRGAAGELSYLPTRLSGFTEQPRLGALAYGFYDTLRAVSHDPDLPGWEAAIFRAAAAGQCEAARAVGIAVQHLALAIVSLVTVLDPELIVLREEFPHTGELLVNPLRAMLASVGLPTPIEISSLGRDAGLIGVALLSAEVLERELLSGA